MGFQHLTPEQRRAVSSIGGSAKRTKPTGFQLMSPERLKEVSRKGGKVKSESA